MEGFSTALTHSRLLGRQSQLNVRNTTAAKPNRRAYPAAAQNTDEEGSMTVSRKVIFLAIALAFSVTLVSAAWADAPEPAKKKQQTVSANRFSVFGYLRRPPELK